MYQILDKPAKVQLSFVYERYGKYFNEHLREMIERDISIIKCDSGFVDFVCSLYAQFYQHITPTDDLQRNNRKMLKKFIKVRDSDPFLN